MPLSDATMAHVQTTVAVARITAAHRIAVFRGFACSESSKLATGDDPWKLANASGDRSNSSFVDVCDMPGNIAKTRVCRHMSSGRLCFPRAK